VLRPDDHQFAPHGSLLTRSTKHRGLPTGPNHCTTQPPCSGCWLWHVFRWLRTVANPAYLHGEQLFAARERSRRRRRFALSWHFFVAFRPHYDNVPFTQPAWYAVKNCTVVAIALRAELLRINLKRHACIRGGERFPAPPAFLLAQGNFERPRPARAVSVASRGCRRPWPGGGPTAGLHSACARVNLPVIN
jgi:hypothetical protein